MFKSRQSVLLQHYPIHIADGDLERTKQHLINLINVNLNGFFSFMAWFIFNL